MKKTLTILNAILLLFFMNNSLAQSLFKDLIPGPHPASSTPDDFMNVGNTMYFVTAVSSTGSSLYNNQLWKSDGTVAGTVLLKDSLSVTNIAHPVKLRANANGILYFTVIDNPGCSVCAPELWKSDGTVAGTVMITTLDYTSYWGGGTGSEPTSFVASGNKLYFVFNNTDNDYELWTSDGTANGTFEIINLCESCSGVDPETPIFSYHEKVYFSGTTTSYDNYELFVSDGTSGGTGIVKEINPENQFGMNFGSESNNWYIFNDHIFFTATDGTNFGIWKTDGTEVGTVLVKAPIDGFTLPIIFKNKLYFGNGNTALWKTDGTEAGTELVKENIGNIRGANNDFLFTHNMTTLTSPPYYADFTWKSDGTTAGTTEVSNHIGMSASRSVIGNNMYITRLDSAGSTNIGVWVTDGTDSGTSKLLEGYGTGYVHIFNNNAFFTNYETATGYELWSISGSGTNNLTENNKNELILYPNPTNGVVYLKSSSLKNTKISITNISGKLLLEKEEVTEIDLSTFVDGVYFVNVLNDGINYTHKIIVQK
ncbi:MAG: T9SS type A sorting domain-containing protein [Flavobacteriia bacterium]|nr:T9SS type A sorting domain-containing protein [Flavobacteriia bacterium]